MHTIVCIRVRSVIQMDGCSCSPGFAMNGQHTTVTFWPKFFNDQRSWRQRVLDRNRRSPILHRRHLYRRSIMESPMTLPGIWFAPIFPASLFFSSSPAFPLFFTLFVFLRRPFSTIFVSFLRIFILWYVSLIWCVSLCTEWSQCLAFY